MVDILSESLQSWSLHLSSFEVTASILNSAYVRLWHYPRIFGLKGVNTDGLFVPRYNAFWNQNLVTLRSKALWRLSTGELCFTAILVAYSTGFRGCCSWLWNIWVLRNLFYRRDPGVLLNCLCAFDVPCMSWVVFATHCCYWCCPIDRFRASNQTSNHELLLLELITLLHQNRLLPRS